MKKAYILFFAFAGIASLRGMEEEAEEVAEIHLVAGPGRSTSADRSNPKADNAIDLDKFVGCCYLCYRIVNQKPYSEQERHSKECLKAPDRLHTVMKPNPYAGPISYDAKSLKEE